MAERTVDLRSDTTTRPTDEMHEAMRTAEVGDDGFGDDPTVNRLQDLAVEKLGMEAARKLRSGIGGTMLQAGTIAAAGIIALEKMVDRLAQDHEQARRLCEGLRTIGGISPHRPPNPTNFVMVDGIGLGWSSSDLAERVETAGLKVIQRPPNDLRLVLHRHITGDDVDYAIEVLRSAAVAA